MKNVTLFPIVVLLVILSSCGIAKNKTGITEISFGSGGGFTGARTTYILHEDGKLDVAQKSNKTLQSKEVNSLFKQANAIKNEGINDPENIYKFIEITRASGTTKYVWGSKTEIPEELKTLYANLMSYTD